MKSLLNYFVRSIRYRRERKIRSLSNERPATPKPNNEDKIRITKGLIDRVSRIENEIKDIDRLLDMLNNKPNAEVGVRYFYHGQSITCAINSECVKGRFFVLLKQRKEELKSMLNEILIQEYENNNRRTESSAQ